MKSNLLMNFTADKENNKIKVEREFAAPLSTVWDAWTNEKILDQWWAPKPWKANTKSMDFKQGGTWLYNMTGPEGEIHWSKLDYLSITPLKNYQGKDAFCDENGKTTGSLPSSVWNNTFKEKGDHTLVSIEISYEKLEDLEKYMEMGFKEGFTAGMENLDEVLASK